MYARKMCRSPAPDSSCGGPVAAHRVQDGEGHCRALVGETALFGIDQPQPALHVPDVRGGDSPFETADHRLRHRFQLLRGLRRRYREASSGKADLLQRGRKRQLAQRAE